MDTKNISDRDLNSYTKDELSRILICTNDGQGDTNAYNYEDIYKIISESDLSIDNKWVKGETAIINMKPSEILDEFCKELMANMTEYIYFDITKNKFCKIQWV